MKRIVFCFDGTWNSLGADNPTNVVLTAASISRTTHDKITQIIHYDDGVGTGRLEKWSGGIFGSGLTTNIREAYRFLIFNYDPGDELYVFGFSRGAFSARSFIGLVRHAGPLHRLHAGRIDEAIKLYQQRSRGIQSSGERMREFRASYSDKVCIDQGDDDYRCGTSNHYTAGDAPLLKFTFLGIWDTVKALGMPDIVPFSSWWNRKHAFHDAEVTNFVESARHAVAIDERRALFPVTRMANIQELNAQKSVDRRSPDAPYQERWFPGTHGSVGGGGDIRGLSDEALAWVIDGAKKAGLVLDTEHGTRIHGFRPDPNSPLINETNARFSFTQILKRDREGPEHIWQLSPFAVRRWTRAKFDGEPYHPLTLSKVESELNSIDGSQYKPQFDAIRTMHTVQPGETLRQLASQYYGDPNLYESIFNANLDIMDNANTVYAGWELRIPEITNRVI